MPATALSATVNTLINKGRELDTASVCPWDDPVRQHLGWVVLFLQEFQPSMPLSGRSIQQLTIVAFCSGMPKGHYNEPEHIAQKHRESSLSWHLQNKGEPCHTVTQTAEVETTKLPPEPPHISSTI
jgi:hypothetical protein